MFLNDKIFQLKYKIQKSFFFAKCKCLHGCIDMHVESWSLYFSEEQYTVFNESIKTINNLKNELRDTIPKCALSKIHKTSIFEIDYDYFKNLETSYSTGSDIETFIDCISCAVSELHKEQSLNIKRVITRIINFSKIKQNRHITTDFLEKIIFVRGTICRAGFKKILVQKAFFKCKKCDEILHVDLQDNILKQPSKCLGRCKSKAFIFLYNHPQTVFRDVQEIKVQRFSSTVNSENEDSVIDCTVKDDFVGTLVPGDVISFCGVVKAENENNSLYKLVVNINNLEHFNSKSLFLEDLDCEENDFLEFKNISKDKSILASFIHSLYPDIYGHDLIKLGMLVSLFGGSRKFVGHNRIRSEIHTLIIGDPGLGKSRMLSNSCSLISKSVYVSGNLTTSVGLTVSIAHDPASGDYMADAGALVVSDNGLCCIDEFDKIDDHSSLFEAMEDQKVTVAKGGVICSVPTRSTIIAAANPKYGHFNQAKTIKENLRFDNALLSRFDLVFILIDNLNEKENFEISDQILKRRHLSSLSTSSNLSKFLSDLKTDKFMKVLHRTSETNIYTKDILKKYISYARANVMPVLSVSAKEEIKKFYLEIKKQDGTAVRNLESIIRIAESRAKIELRSIATKEDARFSIDFYKRLMEKHAIKNKKFTNIRDLINLLNEESKNKENKTFTKEELLTIYDTMDIKKAFTDVIDQLNHKGVLIKKAANEYKFVNDRSI